MVVQQQAANAGRWRLRPQVLAACGAATKFGPIELQLAEWVESGDHATPATTEEVLPYLAGYLRDAADAGRRWGRLAGIAVGAVAGLVLFLVVLAVR